MLELLVLSEESRVRGPIAAGLLLSYAQQARMPIQVTARTVRAVGGEAPTRAVQKGAGDLPGIELHRARRVNQVEIERADLILCMEPSQQARLNHYHFGVALPNCFVWSSWLELAATTSPNNRPFRAWTEALATLAGTVEPAGVLPMGRGRNAVRTMREELDEMASATVKMLFAATVGAAPAA